MVRLMWAVALALAGGQTAPAQQIAREGPFEKLVLDGGEAKAWSPAEATLETVTEPVGGAHAALHPGVAVDYKTGEPNYPIGWPRATRPFAEPWQRDWSSWDYFRLRIYTRTSRPGLPGRPLGLTLYTPDKPSAYQRSLPELKKDQWVELLIPIATIPRANDVTRIQLYLSESDYADGDHVDFFVDDLCLLRYFAPAIGLFELGQQAAFADARYVPGTVALLGLPPGEKRTVACELLSGSKVVAGTELALERGTHRVWLDLGTAKRAAGDYSVRARLGESVAGPLPLRLIESPYR
jgi:hypothetical protein